MSGELKSFGWPCEQTAVCQLMELAGTKVVVLCVKVDVREPQLLELAARKAMSAATREVFHLGNHMSKESKEEYIEMKRIDDFNAKADNPYSKVAEPWVVLFRRFFGDVEPL